MAEKRDRQTVTAPGIGSRLGTQVERDGIIFSAAISSEEQVRLILYRKGTVEIAEELPFPEQPYGGIVHFMKVTGISPRDYEYNFRIGKKVVLDPAARLVVGRENFGDMTSKGEHQIRGGFVQPGFDWGAEEKQPRIP